MTQPPSPRSVAPYLVGFVVIGISLSIAGPALDHLEGRLRTDSGGVAWVLTLQSFGYILGSLVGGRMLDRGLGHRLWSASIVVIAAAVVGASVVDSLAGVAAMFAIIGLASGAADVGGNTLVLWSRPGAASVAMNGLHLCFALGAVTAPLIINRSLHWFDSIWAASLPIVAVGSLAIWRCAHAAPPPALHESDHGHLGGPSATPVLAAAFVFFAAYVALEAGFSGWIHKYTVDVGYGSDNTATAVIVTFWLGFALGRVLAVAAADRIRPGPMVAGSMVASVGASAVFVAAPGGGLSLFAITFAFGLTTAPQFAGMINYIENHRRLSGAATSVFVLGAGVGGLVFPKVIGELFDWRGEGTLPPTLLALAMLTLVAAGLVRLMVIRGDARSAPAGDIDEAAGEVLGGITG